MMTTTSGSSYLTLVPPISNVTQAFCKGAGAGTVRCSESGATCGHSQILLHGMSIEPDWVPIAGHVVGSRTYFGGPFGTTPSKSR
ncbi:hypothetical protein COCOBI_12-2080 [Coccomyxa sp. Obi]|nr:hypothetical protein COCOBI_12-2080 [Coccomyxa sp. Obi]